MRVLGYCLCATTLLGLTAVTLRAQNVPMQAAAAMVRPVAPAVRVAAPVTMNVTVPALPRVMVGTPLVGLTRSAGLGTLAISAGSAGGPVTRGADSSGIQDVSNLVPNAAEMWVGLAPDLHTENLGDFALRLRMSGLVVTGSMGGGDVNLASSGLMGMARSAGVAEARVQLATRGGMFGVIVQGRAVTERSQLFVTPLFSTAGWVVTEKPAFSLYCHF